LDTGPLYHFTENEVRYLHLLANAIYRDAPDPILGQDSLVIFVPMNDLFLFVLGDAQFSGYSFTGLMEFVEINDSTYFCHRLHVCAYISK
jgi:hypothetical protein